jgi:hypothetical protein
MLKTRLGGVAVTVEDSDLWDSNLEKLYRVQEIEWTCKSLHCWSRQQGASECASDVIASVMVVQVKFKFCGSVK